MQVLYIYIRKTIWKVNITSTKLGKLDEITVFFAVVFVNGKKRGPLKRSDIFRSLIEIILKYFRISFFII